MIGTLIGVVIGGLLTTVSTLLLQSRASRTIARSEIYIDLISHARAQPTGSASSHLPMEEVLSIRRRAVLLGHAEAKAAVKAEQLLTEAQRLIEEERHTGKPKTTEYRITLAEYNDQINELERLVSRRLRWPA